MLARGAHLLFFLAIGNIYGANSTTDSVLLLLAPLVIAMTMVSSASEVIIMPTMHRAMKTGAAGYLYKKLRNYTSLFSLFISLIAIVSGSILSPKIGIYTILTVLPLPILSALSGIQMGILHSESRHGTAVLGPLYGGLAASFALLLLPKSAHSLALSFLCFEIVRYAGLRTSANTIIRKYANKNVYAPDLLVWAAKGGVIQAIGSFIYSLNLLIDYLFAKNIGAGSVTLVEYASRLWNIVPLLLVGNITIIYASMSRSASKRKTLESGKINKAVFSIGIYSIVLSAIAILMTPLIVHLLYGLGYSAMSMNMQSTLSSLLIFYLMGCSPFIISQVYVRAHSALGAHHFIAIVASMGIVINYLGNWILVPYMGVNGIGLATSITHIANAFFLSLPFLIRDEIKAL